MTASKTFSIRMVLAGVALALAGAFAATAFAQGPGPQGGHHGHHGGGPGCIGFADPAA